MRIYKKHGPARTLAAAAVVALLATACGGDTGGDADATDAAAEDGTEAAMDDMASEDEPMDDMGSEDHTEDSMGSEDMDMDMSGSYGEPADASEADRTIEVNVDNDLAFEPADFEVGVGEVVTFRVSNTGDVEHEFVLGDQAAQDEMAEMMESGDDHGHSGEMSNAVTVHPGETGELTWRFTSEGTVLIGCHVPGHWEAGMQGTVTVG